MKDNKDGELMKVVNCRLDTITKALVNHETVFPCQLVEKAGIKKKPREYMKEFIRKERGKGYVDKSGDAYDLKKMQMKHSMPKEVLKSSQQVLSLKDDDYSPDDWVFFGQMKFPKFSLGPKMQSSSYQGAARIQMDKLIEKKIIELEMYDISSVLHCVYKVDPNDLIPLNLVKATNAEKFGIYGDKHFLPIDLFDDVIYETRSPDEWLASGLGMDGANYCVPAFAFLPIYSEKDTADAHGTLHGWDEVGVYDYDYNIREFKVVPCQLDRGPFSVPRLLICFKGEPTLTAAKRIAQAVNFRNYAENTIRYNALIEFTPKDAAPTYDIDDLFNLLNKASINGRLKVFEKPLQYAIKFYAQVMTELFIEGLVKDHPDIYSYISIPEKTFWIPELVEIKTDMYNFKERKEKLQRNWIYSHPKVWKIIMTTVNECFKIKQMCLFSIDDCSFVTIEEFGKLQDQAATNVLNYLQGDFRSHIISCMMLELMDFGRGHFDLKQNDWVFYNFSKIPRILELIRFLMERALHDLVEHSILSYVHMLETTCHSAFSTDTNFTWGENLLDSQFPIEGLPLFTLELLLSDDGPYYSTPPEYFQTVVLAKFEKIIKETHTIERLGKDINSKLRYSESLYLTSIGMLEPEVSTAIEQLKKALQFIIIPLKAYGDEYRRFLPFYRLNLDDYIEEFFKEIRTPFSVKQELDFYIDQKATYQSIIPDDIKIGPFIVKTANVKDLLVKKSNEIVKRILKTYALKMQERITEASSEYLSIFKRLVEKRTKVEDIVELKEWMETIPFLLRTQHESIKKIIQDYELLDLYYWPLEEAEFESKWEAITWPHKIMTKVAETSKILAEEWTVFLRLQVDDEVSFLDKIDALTNNINTIVLSDNMAKVHEIAVEARRIWRALKESVEYSRTLNTRQKIFKLPVQSYEDLLRLLKEFEPFKDLWTTASDWLKLKEVITDNPLINLDVEEMDIQIAELSRTINKCARAFAGNPICLDIAVTIRQDIEDFKPLMPLIHALKSPGLRKRHWDQICAATGANIFLNNIISLNKIIHLGAAEHVAEISEIADLASKEFVIEKALDKMEEEWKNALMVVTPYKNSGTYIMKVSDDYLQQLDDHIALTQQLSFSPYKGPFEQRITQWDEKIRMAQLVIDEWAECQRQWMYLEPIFASEDITSQLPFENKKFQTVSRSWKRIMKNVSEGNNRIIEVCSDKRLLDQFRNNNHSLEIVQKGLAEYLELKRLAFPRFFFLSDDELLEILAQARNPIAVQPHLRKCFENIKKVTFMEDLCITHMFSSEGECVKLVKSMYPTGTVETWLSRFEKTMQDTVRDTIFDGFSVIETEERTEWVISWPGQIVIAGSQIYWTMRVENGIRDQTLPEFFDFMLNYMDDLRNLTKGDLKVMERQILSALIVIEVHARDVLQNLVKLNITNTNEFDWIKQLRYYWVVDNLKVRAVNAEFQYGYEYLGNTGRLVITPLTDRCYLTLTGALHLKFGGAPAGPAGTGKTETTKDLAKALAIQCVVFNCSDQLDFMAMGKFFKGFAASGAWACFDEFNRIDIEVLSVIAQQITTIQKAQMSRLERFVFEGTELNLKTSCAIFITMNPGYAGRTELPDNLKALFRPCSMMVPDYTLIAEISLFSFGFSSSKYLAGKITTTFKLSSEQLSKQDHYDFGMRAVKTVITVAGNLKREHPHTDENQIILRSLKDVNVPKFLVADLKLFNGIVSDLFPRLVEEAIDYGRLEVAIKASINKFELSVVDGYVKKVIQLFETTIVRHGLMLVGPTGSGKTKCYEILQDAMTSLKGEVAPSGIVFEKVWTYVMNPKSITMGQLYGEFDPMTHEWTDGIFPSLLRVATMTEDTDKRWYIFDGPVDAVWIENMNTVLDDNKKLCLSSGEIIKLTEHINLVFEVADLAVASPATVSRCGMVYLEPSIIGLPPIVQCWLKKLPDDVKKYTNTLTELFSIYLYPGITFLRSKLKEMVPSVDSAVLISFLRLMDCFFNIFRVKEKAPPPTSVLFLMDGLMVPWVVFSMIWSVGGTCDHKSREIFSEWLRDVMVANNHGPEFPAGLVYDYRLHDGGFTMPTDSGELEPPKWLHWMDNVEPYEINEEMKYPDIEVPTKDNVRNAELLGMLLNNFANVICIGPTGTGKTVTISSKLNRNMSKKFLCDFITFSARTSCNQTQDVIESKLEKRKRKILGPPLLKHMIFFIDDFNMPGLEIYGAQPPIELIRQWMDFKGWYNRHHVGEFRYLEDINFVAAMGPPGGGRNPVTARILRHFHYLTFVEMDRTSQETIFQTILEYWMNRTPGLSPFTETVLDATLNVYKTIVIELLPTPSKTHYLFNLRDLSKVFQGIHMAHPDNMKSLDDFVKLWVHENCRVYQDRLINDIDRNWFDELLTSYLKSNFDYFESIDSRTLLYGDFLHPDQPDRVYAQITDMIKLSKVLDHYLDHYNKNETAPMKLVLFLDAISHICRIARIIRQPLGNGLLLGMGGSGRQSLTKLATFISEFVCFQIELSKTYGKNEWKEDIKDIMMKAGLHKIETVFLFSDTQIIMESFLEDINNILNSGDVPNIYASDELDKIYQLMKLQINDLSFVATKSNIFSYYLKSVKSNMHCVITMSPIGELFRSRLRQFPALVNCCTIDWFFPWPDAALQSVALQFLDDAPSLDASDEVLDSIVLICRFIHQSIIDASALFLQELSRHNYVTPTSFLELLSLYTSMLETKKKEQNNAIARLQTGLDKLLSTSEDVKEMQKELIALQPALELAQKDANEMLERIEADTVLAEATKEVVSKEEAEASKIAEETLVIAEDAQRDLDEAMPALLAAESALKSLNKNDISEVRALQRPPEGVKMVLEAICIIKNVKPNKVPGAKIGEKVLDYWDPARNMLGDPGAFLNSLINFDKENMTEAQIQKIQPYIDNPDFRPAKIIKVSKACTSLCQWVHAIYVYYFVNLAVAPKKAKLQEARKKQEATDKALAKSTARMKKVMDGIAALRDRLNETMERKNELERTSQACQTRLNQAFRLVNGLSNERNRWIESIAQMQVTLVNVIGDILISAGAVAYLAPFTDKYRRALLVQWRDLLVLLRVPHSANCDPVSTLGDPVAIRRWQLDGLPRDYFSTENGILVFNSKRWPLFIDPQGQANKWLKNTYKDHDLLVMKLNEKELMRQVEASISFGKVVIIENVGIDIDPSLDPVLMKQVFFQAGQTWIKLGDSIIPYNNNFKLYLTTKLSNPHYTPEISTKVLLVNFMLVPSGLQDQLLALVAMEERPDLEETRGRIIVSVAQMKHDLKDLEDKILSKLTLSKGNPIDDIALIDTLEESKSMSEDIRERVDSSAKTQEIIDQIRSEYVPVAKRAQILYFCLADLPSIDPMYQYSLEWFTKIFISSMAKTEKNCEIEDRIVIINEHFTFSLFTNVCRSMFEKNKLQFAFLICVRILIEEGKIDFNEWNFFLSGGSPASDLPNPGVGWLGSRAWSEILSLEHLPVFHGFVEDFIENIAHYRKMIDSHEPHRMPLSDTFDEKLDKFQHMMVVKCLRPDKLRNEMQDFISDHLGSKFIEPQSSDLEAMYKESATNIPLVFILSPGTDPATELYKFADKMRMSKKLSSISLGQGQGPIAEKMMLESQDIGYWIFFQNCHLAPSWMPRLEYLIENITVDSCHKDFRVWLTSMPSPCFPTSILQNGSKLTIEPPRGVKANLLRAYSNEVTEFLDFFHSEHPKAQPFKWLLFSLCLFHSVCLERRKFGPLGFNIPYEFTDGDLRICISQLHMFLKEYSEIPFKVLLYTAGQINYGGRVTDNWDRRTVMTLLGDYYNHGVLKASHSFDEDKCYYQHPAGTEIIDYMDYLKALPVNDKPSLFGLHENADISYAQAETFSSLSILLSLQPKVVGSQASSQEEVAIGVTKNIMAQVPQPFGDLNAIEQRYPVLYEESLNSVLIHEIIRYNNLLNLIHTSLSDLSKALTGAVVMSELFEKMSLSLTTNSVPEIWSKEAYPSLKPLGAWVSDLQARILFLQKWVNNGIPASFWISGFFFPQAFLTGCLQNYARKYTVAIDSIGYKFKILTGPPKARPAEGCVIHGLFLEGARWSPENSSLKESRPKELFTDMPPIWLIPDLDFKVTQDIYECPTYKTLTRAGTLSTTGHSTNYVLTIMIPSHVDQRHWIKRGVALFCALDY